MRMENLFRDFIYMDTERLKSIIAQLNKGLIENKTNTVTEADTDKINGGIDFLKMVKIGGETSFLWQNQTSESHTMHDYLYNLAESSLNSKKLLTKIPGDIGIDNLSDPDKYPSPLTSTSFVLVKGKTIINDFAYMQKILNNLDDLLKSVITGEQSADKSFEKASQNQRNKIVQDRIKELNIPKDIKKALEVFLSNFYGDRVVIKNIPIIERPNFRFVGTLNKLYLRESIENIIYKYGTAPQDDWYMFAQVASIPNKNTDELVMSFNQNELEKGLQSVFDALREIEKTGLSISFPEIAVTPIAIYRQ